MPKYYCPYCLPTNCSIRKPKQGTYICSLCGEKLEKVPFVKLTQIISIFVVFALFSPLLLLFASNLKREQKKISPFSSQEELALSLKLREY